MTISHNTIIIPFTIKINPIKDINGINDQRLSIYALLFCGLNAILEKFLFITEIPG